MKKVSVFQLAVAYAGCFLGAGCVSGKELWQFFGSFGRAGFAGFLISVCVLGIFGTMLMSNSRLTGKTSMDGVIIPWDIPAAKTVTGIIQTVFLFGVAVVMFAGAGALVSQLTGIPSWIFSLVMAAAVAAVAMAGLGGAVAAYSFVVPLIVICTVIIAVLAGIKFGVSEFSFADGSDKNALLPVWYISGIMYAGYNMLAAIGVVAPLGDKVGRGKAAAGIILGCVFFAAVAGSVLFTLSLNIGSTSAELPMTAVAAKISPVLGYIYGVLLIAGMFGTSCSSIAACVNYGTDKIEFVRKHEKLSVAVITAAGFAASLAGFGELVGTVYPAFGYVSMVFLVFILITRITSSKKRDRNVKTN